MVDGEGAEDGKRDGGRGMEEEGLCTKGWGGAWDL